MGNSNGLCRNELQSRTYCKISSLSLLDQKATPLLSTWQVTCRSQQKCNPLSKIEPSPCAVWSNLLGTPGVTDISVNLRTPKMQCRFFDRSEGWRITIVSAGECNIPSVAPHYHGVYSGVMGQFLFLVYWILEKNEIFCKVWSFLSYF